MFEHLFFHIYKFRNSVNGPTGLLALFIALGAVAAIITDHNIIPGTAGIHEDMAYLGENINRLKWHVFIWLTNSILIILFSTAILLTLMPHNRILSYFVFPVILAIGLVYLFSTILGFGLVSQVTDHLAGPHEQKEIVALNTLPLLYLGHYTKLTALSLSGLAAVLAGLFIGIYGVMPRMLGWMAVLGGSLYAVYGWVNHESLIFTFGRLMFILSLFFLGLYLLLSGSRKTGP